MNLGDRMKRYEGAHRIYLPPRIPVIIRVDGKAFHTLSRGCAKPFDAELSVAMDHVALKLLKEVQNARLAFVQSDEVSLLLIDYNKHSSQQWFDGNLQKMVSISAAYASVEFNNHFCSDAVFDSRAFVLPEKEVVNYFIWRQQDAMRNAILMVAQSRFSHKQMHGTSCGKLLEMLHDIGVDYEEHYASYWRMGRALDKNSQPPCAPEGAPLFSNNRAFIEQYMQVEEGS
jgi:tRNA(His) 5'-end guanylyltransferase